MIDARVGHTCDLDGGNVGVGVSVGVSVGIGEAIRACGQHDIATRKVDAIFDIVVVAAAAVAAVTAQTAAAAWQRRGAFVVAFMVVDGTAISSDLLKKIEEILT